MRRGSCCSPSLWGAGPAGGGGVVGGGSSSAKGNILSHHACGAAGGSPSRKRNDEKTTEKSGRNGPWCPIHFTDFRPRSPPRRAVIFWHFPTKNAAARVP